MISEWIIVTWLSIRAMVYVEDWGWGCVSGLYSEVHSWGEKLYVDLLNHLEAKKPRGGGVMVRLREDDNINKWPCFTGSSQLNEGHFLVSTEAECWLWLCVKVIDPPSISTSRAGPIFDSIPLYPEYSKENLAHCQHSHQKVDWMVYYPGNTAGSL